MQVLFCYFQAAMILLGIPIYAMISLLPRDQWATIDQSLKRS